jgi:hypothetical protein
MSRSLLESLQFLDSKIDILIAQRNSLREDRKYLLSMMKLIESSEKTDGVHEYIKGIARAAICKMEGD